MIEDGCARGELKIEGVNSNKRKRSSSSQCYNFGEDESSEEESSEEAV